jgi:hypothetical protein
MLSGRYPQSGTGVPHVFDETEETGGTPVLRALRPEGPRELSPGFSLGRFHPHDGKPCRGRGMPPYID